LISGIFSKHSRFLFILSFILTNAIAVIWNWGNGLRVEALFEVFAGSVIFALLPSSLLSYAGSILQRTPAGSGEAGLRRYSALRIQKLGEAFRDLYQTVKSYISQETNDNEITSVFDRAADAVCASCKNKERCWHLDYMDTLSIMNDVTKAMLERGRLVKEDFAQDS
jgi:stage II sporulation protein E